MTTNMQGHFKRARQMRNSLSLMCYLSLITSCLALSQIFSYLVRGVRILVLCSAENALLRLCFVIVVLLIVVRDIQQIAINLFVRISGVMMMAKQSRSVMVEYLARTMISLLAMTTIMVVIFTTPKGDEEGVIV